MIGTRAVRFRDKAADFVVFLTVRSDPNAPADAAEPATLARAFRAGFATASRLRRRLRTRSPDSIGELENSHRFGTLAASLSAGNREEVSRCPSHHR